MWTVVCGCCGKLWGCRLWGLAQCGVLGCESGHVLTDLSFWSQFVPRLVLEFVEVDNRNQILRDTTVDFPVPGTLKWTAVDMHKCGCRN